MKAPGVRPLKPAADQAALRRRPVRESVRAGRRHLRTLLRVGRPFGEPVVIAVSLAVGAYLVMGIPLVFGPNGTVDPYGYREYDEPETICQMALACLSVVGPLAIGALLVTSALRNRR